jgi:hypothetical protein
MLIKDLATQPSPVKILLKVVLTRIDEPHDSILAYRGKTINAQRAVTIDRLLNSGVRHMIPYGHRWQLSDYVILVYRFFIRGDHEELESVRQCFARNKDGSSNMAQCEEVYEKFLVELIYLAYAIKENAETKEKKVRGEVYLFFDAPVKTRRGVIGKSWARARK